ncbi:glutathione S-transferase family protein [Shewanella surugensis]|uniref:Glutathione S-transferase family protein n=1 Tax=Shewanella surugensis TaxID=212020 RepID=A0ABT0LCS2_9GAMM|nr:glutathione S-transferase family protein [Shewanella surugensis]MCL1125501.1 glutathione S-transferase family protein [Shewanella surugensis]
MKLYYHPLCRHAQKVLIALYEKQAYFHPHVVELNDAQSRHEFKSLSPLTRLPLLLLHDDTKLPESSIIIELIDSILETGTQLLPKNMKHSLEIRLYDRLIDHDLHFTILALEAEKNHKQLDQLKLKSLKNKIKLFLDEMDEKLNNSYWLCSDHFSLADCALLPCLFSLQHEFHLLDYEHLGRYWMQAQLRGSYLQVKQEIELACADNK